MKIQDLTALCRGMKKAHEVSLEANHPDYRLGCAIVVGKRVTATGYNDKHRSHPYVHHHGTWFNHGIHAELAAIFKVKNRECLKGATIYIYRQTKQGTFANARPCPMCFELIKQCGFKKMVYTVENGIIEEKIK